MTASSSGVSKPYCWRGLYHRLKLTLGQLPTAAVAVYQDFAAELAALPGKYAPPDGDLLIARGASGELLGCVGLRPLSMEGCCEMKRLFLRPAARGLGLGRAMSEAVIAAARWRGYGELRLDTLPTMTAAIGLYAHMGFEVIAPYYAPTPPGTIFLGLRL